MRKCRFAVALLLGWFFPVITACSFALAAPAAKDLSGRSHFKRALPGYRFSFPADHAAHPEFRTEWWYYTGHLTSHKQRTFGFQLTFFRHALRPSESKARSRWSLHTIYFAHFAITDEQQASFRFLEKVSRGSLGLAGTDPQRYRVWIADWSSELRDGVHQLQAGDDDMSIDLRLQPLKPPILHGEQGLSQKAAGEGYASYYYSIPRLQAAGTLSWQGKRYAVNGIAWMDHEFGSNQLREYQVGWDWFSVQLDNNVELMLYIIRHRNGTPDPNSSGTIIYQNSQFEHLPLASLQVKKLGTWHSKESGAVYPSGWLLQLPHQRLQLTLLPTVKNQELTTATSTLVTYWEGSVKVTGTLAGKPVTGAGYVELTGYIAAFRPDI
ncbi:MAG: carotenoid 1,2-hydratase [Deltaproteobacteria bacterium]|nr:carotenoid 1,2-hydratase [Deltaproteobacteria bacterium]MBW2069797.1 carotenoid 1,2-hydratase [Deltaproteobacteria bacterium]